ncbi:Undecaprenyl-phosphate 4-deoxy-4-formamido-L-arabinose transferase [Paenibacillus plantiphilus]|uniref:Undecaprenyl-phosphate 4-deoxy-4-formamido-L-arabinose transferase n=2 Tax=Paenibacillus plantiphilus TaxID=2905650 RepID=A0ABM9C2S1_9BACL|nr:Undecaprenyl-phosphate 4-deoxy-4-formamido-L-arabinose transferase [Paenibacillus plantiphilus]
MHTQLSVIIPVYNSQDSIGIVVEKLLMEYADLYRMEIIMVNDGSVDRSKEVCTLLANQHFNVTLLDLERNYGQQTAIFKGLALAQGDYIALMDDDMQNPPEELVKLVNKIAEGFDVVIGQRVAYKQSSFRKLISYLNTLTFNYLSHSGKKMYFSNFIIMQKSIVKEILKRSSSNPNVYGSILQMTDNIAHTPTLHRKRQHGRSNYTLWKLLRHWFNSLPYFTTKATRFSLFLALFLILGMVITFIYLWI